MKLHDLDQLIRAVCPIDGIDSNGNITFKPEAAQPQRDAAEALMAQHLGSINDIEETDFGTINANALLRRRAKELQDSGQDVAALLLLKTIGE